MDARIAVTAGNGYGDPCMTQLVAILPTKET